MSEIAKCVCVCVRERERERERARAKDRKKEREGQTDSRDQGGHVRGKDTDEGNKV